jgi:hypothetical protein
VYALALRLGTSFEATALHLANLKLTEPAQAREWAATPLKTVKEGLCAGSSPASYRGDVWVLDPSRDEMQLSVAAGDRVIVSFADPFADLRPAALSVVTEMGSEETVSGATVFEDRVGEEGDLRVIVDFGEADGGIFRLVVSRGADSLPGLEEIAHILEFDVHPGDLGRRIDSVAAPTVDRQGSVSSIGGGEQ